MKPMSAAYSRKQRRHRSRPYLRMIPWVLLHTRLHSTARNRGQHHETNGSAPAGSHCPALCSTAMVIAAVHAIIPRHSHPSCPSTPTTRLRCLAAACRRYFLRHASAAMFDLGRSPFAGASRVLLRVGVVSIRHLDGKMGASEQRSAAGVLREQQGAIAN